MDVGEYSQRWGSGMGVWVWLGCSLRCGLGVGFAVGRTPYGDIALCHSLVIEILILIVGVVLGDIWCE